MSSKIIRLPDHLINQIAAGEVVENPASIVKELIENSIDAQAENIHVEIKAGGQQFISISDDGCGMTEEEALLSLERHATSKIKAFEDFDTLNTMGFRGEALPSIASISRLIMKTATLKSEATLIEMHGGELIRCERVARNPGTTIEIRSLFFNTPARKKFQKSSQASTVEILKILTLLALAHPHISFEMKQNNEVVFQAPKSQNEAFIEALKERASYVLGTSFSKNLHLIHYDDDFCKICGFLAPLTETRPNRREQYIFVNKRGVHSPLVSYAVKDAVSTRLDKDRYPLFILHLELPGHLVDVNVHPQKKEVRFREESYLRSAVIRAIADSLQLPNTQNALKPEASINWDILSSSFEPFKTFDTYNFSSYEKKPSQEPYFELNAPFIKPIGLYENWLLLSGKDLKEYLKEPHLGIIFLDLKEAEALIEYEKLKQKNWQIEKQVLLFPLGISLSLADAAFANDKIFLFEKLGMEVRATSKNTFAIESLPYFVDMSSAELLFNNLLSKMQKGETVEELFKEVCQFPVRYKNHFMIEQAEMLLKKLLSLTPPLYSLKGQPLMCYLDNEEIHALFKRKDTFV